MHSISLVAVGILLAITICPYNTNGTTTENTELEEPVMMALSSKPEEKTPYKREVWQESEGEVLIRNERGTKENGSGSTTGKKQNKKDNKNPNNTKNAHKQQHLNKTSDTNSKSENIPSTTQETVRKHQQKHEKHENKMNSNSNKKHASTDKQKHKDENSCRYTKGTWTECDPKTNTRSRTLTLKKGEGSCVQTRTIQKKCKKGKSEKACRYDKGNWGECQPNGEMTRIDKLKATSDSATCPPIRTMNKKCNKSKQEKQMKNRNSKEKKQNDRKNRQ
ncbi:nucleolar protein 58-like isoform X1 [Chironomus tepperi]|uniref:nucleolar protein 58-like isoform X1 n=1 Tax=Chironomus tepperi TaxID=113505 RepID=UPI00391F6429